METIKLNFDADVFGPGKSITLEVPYSEGFVATSRFCPTELLSGDVELLAALNGESLEDFVKDCKFQLFFAKTVSESSSLPETFIAGLMAAVLEHASRPEKLSMKEYLLHVDAFAHLINAGGVSEEQVKEMYPGILDSILKTVESQSNPE